MPKATKEIKKDITLQDNLLWFSQDEYEQNYKDGVNKAKVDVQVEIQLVLDELRKELKKRFSPPNWDEGYCREWINKDIDFVFDKLSQSNPKDGVFLDKHVSKGFGVSNPSKEGNDTFNRGEHGLHK